MITDVNEPIMKEPKEKKELESKVVEPCQKERKELGDVDLEMNESIEYAISQGIGILNNDLRKFAKIETTNTSEVSFNSFSV